MTIAFSEQQGRVVLHNTSWETYERLVAERRENRAPRFTYDLGELEIVSPLLPEHEGCNFHLELLVSILAEELRLAIRGLGSATMKREDIGGGIEPDSCFYVQHEPQVRGKSRLDLRVDPPPDLAIEIDITHASLDKLALYARFGVPEVWRYDGRQLEIWVLGGDRCVQSRGSVALRGVRANVLSALLKESMSARSTEWLTRVRQWARELGGVAGDDC